MDLGSWIRARIETQSFNPVSIQATVREVPQTLCACVGVCLFAMCWGIHVGRQTYRRHEEQIGRDCTRRAQNRQNRVDLWGGIPYIYIYVCMYVCIYIYILYSCASRDDDVDGDGDSHEEKGTYYGDDEEMIKMMIGRWR